MKDRIKTKEIGLQILDNEVILSLQDLTKSYGDLKAVDGLSLEVRRGEIFGFLGPNGAGKTTTIHMICGLLKSDSGEITVNGMPMSEHLRECRKGMGLCPQNLVIWETLTCLEQLEFMARLYDIAPRPARKKSLEILETLGLQEKKNKLAKTLSGGMKRRLNIALALVQDPSLLILDEPTAGLDPQSRVLVRETIRSMAKKITVVLTTHEMDEADRLSDRVAVIDRGRLLVLDAPANLKKRIGEGDVMEITLAAGHGERLTHLERGLPETIRHLSRNGDILRLVGADIPGLLPGLMEKFRARGLKIEDLAIRKKTLEDVFIALTGRRLRE
jgi:ABC-2 type transport system ATP-binding protein